MSDLICSEAFRSFLNDYKTDVFAQDETLGNISESIAPLAKELGYLNLYVSLDAPVSDSAAEGLLIHTTIFGEELFANEEQKREAKFITGEGGVLIIGASMPAADEWTKNAEEDFKLLAKLLYVFFGRARVMNILRYSDTHDKLSKALTIDGLMISAGRLFAENPGTVFDCVAINIRNLKFVNDKASQSGGNLAIYKYAAKLIKFLGKKGRVARSDGDNFVVLVEDSRLDELLEFLKSVRLDITVDGKTMSFDMPCSAGIFKGRDHTPLNAMIYKSMLTMNYLKDYRLGDSLVYTEEIEEQVNYYKKIVGRFKEAIKNKQFSVFYQPKVDVETKTLIGAEALVRWYDNGTFISPMNFIPILEREGYISTLDYFVFDKACEDIENWLKQGIEPVRISTNFSKDNLKNINLIQDVLDIVEKHGIDGKYLEIEFTELCDFKDMDAMCAFIHTMQSHGITITVDDFGKGYSSFDLIRMLDMNVIKIDKSLVDNVCREGSADKVILDHVVRMFIELDKEVIAEGVETVEQARLLEKTGCKHVQGYLFDKPLPHYDFERRLVTRNYYENIIK
ncbi:MAG: bifunctional diguanylate cyclase/phosphodiesterase [Lachnospiraceae bacterium]|nr:bifunctional diguanylate cyclase/phosphodiesterase [Lachnospiraceae bacterium]